jgi:hypothetical protein
VMNATLHGRSNTTTGSAGRDAVRHLLFREQNGSRGNWASWAQTYSRDQLRTLQLSTSKGLAPTNPQILVGDLALDHVEFRFLLTTWGDASLSIYDTQAEEVRGLGCRQQFIRHNCIMPSTAAHQVCSKHQVATGVPYTPSSRHPLKTRAHG